LAVSKKDIHLGKIRAHVLQFLFNGPNVQDLVLLGDAETCPVALSCHLLLVLQISIVSGLGIKMIPLRLAGPIDILG
jgi:hypothetical protein